MIVDSSALVAILFIEDEATDLAGALRSATRARTSAASVLETALVVRPELADDLDDLLAAARIDIVAFDAEQLAVARAAMVTYGRGSRSPAKLNFGDCMSYALAKVSGESLLFKGDDFTHTDIEAAWLP